MSAVPGQGLSSTPPETTREELARPSSGSEPCSARGRWPGGRFSGKQLLLALAVAALADGLSVALTLAPPVQWVIDGTTAVLLFLVLGWHWALLPGLVMEAIPGLYVFPFWVLVVASLATVGSPRGGSRAALAPAREDRGRCSEPDAAGADVTRPGTTDRDGNSSWNRVTRPRTTLLRGPRQ